VKASRPCRPVPDAGEKGIPSISNISYSERNIVLVPRGTDANGIDNSFFQPENHRWRRILRRLRRVVRFHREPQLPVTNGLVLSSKTCPHEAGSGPCPPGVAIARLRFTAPFSLCHNVDCRSHESRTHRKHSGAAQSMNNFFRAIGHLAYHAGAAGLLTVGFLDSTFLIIPFGNDILLIALSVRHHKLVPLYALAATVGSVLGCWFTIWLSAKGGAHFRKRVPLKRLKYVQAQVEKRAGWAVAFASIMPPPFPFTAVVAAAAAFDYPRKKLFLVIGAARFVRFSIEGALAIYYGRKILILARSETLKYILVPIIVISIIGSAYSIYSWIKDSAKQAKRPKGVPARA
jgi:membrane protein YqaA with SNARE-associated domain